MAPEAKLKVGRIASAIHITLPERWYTYAVQDIPETLRIGQAAAKDTADLIEEEVFSQTGLRPVKCKPSLHRPNTETDTST